MQKKRLVLNFLDFETHISAKIQVQFSNLGLSRKFSTRGELFYWRPVSFVPRIRNLTVIKL